MKAQKTLKKYFIPHHHNDFKPHIFREVSIIIMVLIVIFLFGVSIGSKYFLKSTVLGASISTSVLIDMTNETRLATNEAPLIRNNKLDIAAQMKAEDMIKGGYFAHVSPTGEKAWNFIYNAGYIFKYAGENLAINFNNDSDVHVAWVNSPTHKANLIDIKFKEIGMSAIEGSYQGSPTVYIVQMFGTPAKEKVSINKQQETLSLDSQNIELNKTIPGNELAINISSSTNTNTSEVKGASTNVTGNTNTTNTANIYNISNVIDVTKLKNIKTIVDNTSLNVVEDLDAEALTSTTPIEKYSKWYERFIYDGEKNVNKLYMAMFVFIALSLIVSLIVELHRQHYKHVFYGIGLLFLIVALSVLAKYIEIV